MKQYTLRQIQDLPLKEKLDFLKEPRELGVKTAGPKGEFEVKGVYLPMSEYKELNRAANYDLSFNKYDLASNANSKILVGENTLISGGGGGGGVFNGAQLGVDKLKGESDEQANN